MAKKRGKEEVQGNRLVPVTNQMDRERLAVIYADMVLIQDIMTSAKRKLVTVQAGLDVVVGSYKKHGEELVKYKTEEKVLEFKPARAGNK